MRDTHLRFDVSLRLAQETIRSLVQLARGRLYYFNVASLVAPHLILYILVLKKTAGVQFVGNDDREVTKLRASHKDSEFTVNDGRTERRENSSNGKKDIIRGKK